MILTLAILLAFSIYMLFANIKSKYIRMLFLMVIVLGISIVFLQIYIAKYINYSNRFQTATNIVFSLDYWLWHKFGEIMIGAHTVNRIINVASAVFIYAIVVFSIWYTKEKLARKTVAVFALLALLPIEIILFYDPLISFQIFISVTNGMAANNSNIVLNLVRALQIINYYLINAYFLYAIVILFVKYFRTKLKIKKNQILFIIAQILPLALIFLLVFIWGPVKDVDIYTYSIRLSFTPTDFSIPYMFFELLPILAAVFLIIDIYLIAKHQIVIKIERHKKQALKNKLREANQYYQGVFHAFKNNFIAIKLLSDRINNDDTGSDETKKLGEQIVKLCNEYITKISLLQSRLKKVWVTLTEVNLSNMLEELKQDVENAYGRSVVITAKTKEVVILADKVYLLDALKNFLVNSVEATQNQTDARIEIQLDAESEWAIIRIIDNGVGMSETTLKELFKPFYSTKNLKNNWGIGLSYSQAIIYSHGGDITVKSKENEYTIFEIVLPRVWR